jgi:hypothetical protein
MALPKIAKRTILLTTGILLVASLTDLPVSSASAAIPTSCAAVTGVKPLLRGLVDRTQIPPAADLQAAAIEVKWKDLEPVGPGLVANNPIDVAIAAAGCVTPLRLRVIAGMAAPEWVKQASGGDISVVDPFDNTPGTIGHFWTDPFKQAYDNLQSELAAAYDSVPNLDEVVVSRCSMFYPEPFLRGISIPSNRTNLLAAGYTVAADKVCQLEEIDSAVTRWATTRVGVSFNPYQVLNSDGTFGPDESYTEQVMGYCRYTAGPRCVLENDSIRDPISSLGAGFLHMYAVMSGAAGPVHVTIGGLDVEVQLGAPIAFQTAVMAKIGDFWGTLIWARQHHAASVELPVDGTYPTTGGSGAPAWQTIAEVAAWFQEDPVITATPLGATEGMATSGIPLASLSLDELAALDTVAGYGDVGAVPFDTVSASVNWPDGSSEAAMLTTGQGGASSVVTCPQQRSCAVTIESGGHALAEEAAAAPATVIVSLAAGITYEPADGVSIVAGPMVSVSDAPLSLVKMRVVKTITAGKVRLNFVFADADPGALVSDYTVSVDWGDKSIASLAVVSATGGFSSSATHTYATSGTYSVRIAAADAGGATLAAKRWITVG